MLERSLEISGKTKYEKPFNLTLLVMEAAFFGPIMRSHWAVENSLHRVMEMIFRYDECRVRAGHVAVNLTIIQHMVYTLRGTAFSRDSFVCEAKDCCLE